MVSITTRQTQLAPLSHAQVDANFLNLKAAVESVTDAPETIFATLAGQDGAKNIGNGLRTVADKLGDTISVKDFGAKGDGVTDDTAAIRAAVTAVGGAGMLTFPAGTYPVSGAIIVSGNILLQGCGPRASVIKPTGSFDVFTFTGGGEGVGIVGLGFSASGMSGGSLVVFSNSDRNVLENIVAKSPFNGVYIKKANVTSLSRLWIDGIRGTFGVQAYGDDVNRCDVIDLNNVVMSCASNTVGATGILIDGNVHTVDARHVAATLMGRGLWVKNTPGGTNPAFVTAYDMQVDFPLNEAVRLEGSARTILLTDVYAHGSVQADGIYIDPTVQNVSISGGLCDSHYKRGVFVGGRYVKINNLQVSNNSAAGSALWSGIEIGAASIGAQILNNLAGQWVGYAANLQAYGVSIVAGAQAYVVMANNLRGNVTGEVIDAANASDSVVAGNTTALGKFAVGQGICNYSGDLSVSTPASNRMSVANGNGVHLQVGGGTASTVNNLRISGDAAGGSPKVLAEGADTNIDLQFVPKGAGTLRFGTLTASADAPVTGYITIRDAGGVLRKLAVIA